MGSTPSLDSIAKQTSLSNSHSQIIIEENRTHSWTEERMVRGGHTETGDQTYRTEYLKGAH